MLKWLYSRFLPTSLVLAMLYPGIFACQLPAIHLGKPVLENPPIVQPGARLAVFTLLARSVGVARSQGIAWVAETDPDDYRRWRDKLNTILVRHAGLTLIEKDKIKAHPMVQGGFFPLREDFHLNPDRLPIVSSKKEVRYMLRTTPLLKPDYFVLVLLDYDVGKTMFRPASVTARIHFELYSPQVGLVYSSETEAVETALPYDRSLSMADLEKSYRTQLKAALDRGMERAMIMFQKKLLLDLKIAPNSVQ